MTRGGCKALSRLRVAGCASLAVLSFAVGAQAVAPGPARVPMSAQARTLPGQAPVPAQSRALPDLDKCVARLDPQVDVGYERIAARCPELMRELDEGAWSAWLPKGWKEFGNDLSAGSLIQLRELVSRENAAAPVRTGPNVQHLKSVLATMGVGGNDDSRWSRFKRWLRSILENRDQPEEEGWFSRMVSHVGFTQSVIDLIVYATLAVVVVLAGVIVANELRNAGVLPKRGRAARSRSRAADANGLNSDWSDVDNAPLSERPRLLLSLLVRRLAELHLVPPAGGLTVRELTRVAKLPAEDDKARLSELALAAEKVRYSHQEIPADSLGEPLARGKELLEHLNASVSP